MGPLETLPLLVIGLAFALVCRSVAAAKGRSKVGWFAAGLVLPLLALLFIAVLPPRQPESG